MKKLTARDVKDLNLLKHYRIIRKWACKNNDLNDADLELLIYFDCMDFFTKHDTYYLLFVFCDLRVDQKIFYLLIYCCKKPS